jgi:hypothetical protein
MTRRRYIYDSVKQELVEVTPDYEAPQRNAHTSDGLLWNDRSYDGLRATDGTDISSRSKHREYMRVNGLTTMDDFKQSFADAQQRKAEYVTQGKHGAVKREHIERAIHEIQSRRK